MAALMLTTVQVQVQAQEESIEALKQDAVERLVAEHDTSLSVNIGRVYVKQAALTTARDLLWRKGRDAGLTNEQWNLDSPEWQEAERKLTAGLDKLIRVEVANPEWLETAWSELSSELLGAEEADEIAVHFRTEGGAQQRRIIEWFVGELTLQYYTFPDRLKYGVPGSEQEMRDLQVTTYEIQSHFEPIYDLTHYPDAMRMKMMVMSGVHVIHLHLEKVADKARATILARASLADSYVAQAKARAG